MKNVAHRGFSGKYPENTMLAFQKAVELGVDGIETDVHLTKDNVIVMIHDEDIRRTCNGTGLIRDYTYEELQQFDASAGFKGQYGINRIPTLKEYFDYVKDLNIFTNIEIKNGCYYYENLEEKVIAMVREYHLEDRILFSTFNHASVMKCKQLAPEIEAGFLCGTSLANAGVFVKSCGVECIHPEFKKFPDEEIANCKAQGIKINVWTPNTEEEIQMMIDKKVDAIITNFPDICKRLINR